MHGQTRYANKAAYLHTVIKKGELATFAAAIGVAAPISDSTQTLNSHFMSSSDYVALCAAHPDWAELVAARAQEVAAERGTRVRMALLCEVAADIPVPDAISASSISEALA
jgi:hypothetical protein